MTKYTTYKNYVCIQGIDKNTLDLDKTFDCGQCFRWMKLEDGTWMGVIANKIFMLKQLEIGGIPSIITTASIDEWETILYEYLDLDTDYSLNIAESDKFAIQAEKVGRGIRILRQDPWETLISFIISQRNNIPKIKSTIYKLCEKLGNRISIEVNGKTYTNYTFPTVDKLLNIEDLQNIGLGYRDTYIRDAAIDIKHGNIKLESLLQKSISGESTVEQLQVLNGVGPKVANCVALLGLHKLDTFPIDVWIQRIINKYYNGNIDISSYGSLAGLMQQYMFYYIKYGNTKI